jgi:hypothetical protein
VAFWKDPCQAVRIGVQRMTSMGLGRSASIDAVILRQPVSLQQSFFKFRIDRCESVPLPPPSEFLKICDKLIYLLW